MERYQAAWDRWRFLLRERRDLAGWPDRLKEIETRLRGARDRVIELSEQITKENHR